jgi:protein-S-isoprenylcysteine O-methyltransferase Ste14
MWLHLGGSYWQRGSFDAVVVVAALLGLIAVAPEFKKFGPGHWTATIGVAVLTVVFGVLLVHSVRRAGHKIMPRLQQLEQSAPG